MYSSSKYLPVKNYWLQILVHKNCAKFRKQSSPASALLILITCMSSCTVHTKNISFLYILLWLWKETDWINAITVCNFNNIKYYPSVRTRNIPN